MMAEETKDPPIFTLFNEIGIIEQLARQRLESVLPEGLKISHFSVLNHFARLGGERAPAELARAFQVTKAAMTNTLGRLEARGLVAIRPDPNDGRAKRVALTARGLKLRDRAIAALGPELAEITAHIPAQDFATALPFLQRLRAYLDEARN
ncbi:MAG TPA: MarR family transcriptional regulator [Alphaproteobacteria bacterium]|jgi:DNA-binding MarR family transcriptional regulator|nr:MarR family transcriptional regulator [Alphaproteobacteria bacterium]|tara:strand:- start:166 stop:618 length:453 start_codon:yes stop_codon:yes gene_type:complete